jgi:uncharacterized protein (TIGR04551 family)
MVKALLAAFALAQTAPAPEQPKPVPGETKPATRTPTNDELQRDLEAARKEIKDMREEIRAQLATQAASEGWQDEWVEEKRKLELFTVDGYFRTRPELFQKLDLGRSQDPDPSGYYLFPVSPNSAREQTMAGVNMRFRLEPTLNVSEEVRIRAQIDFLDNVIFGSTPDYAFTRSDRYDFGIFSESQNSPRSAMNSIQDSINVRRIYGEVSTPFGILRFGRMGSHWGTGMLRNDGNCLECDNGHTVDRLQLVSEPIAGSGFYVAPMLDFNSEGPTTERRGDIGQPFDASNADDAHSFILAIAKRDTDQQAKAKLDNGSAVFNYGAYFSYRVQRRDPEAFYQVGPNGGGNNTNPATPGFTGAGGELNSTAMGYVTRSSALYMPDVWAKLETKSLTLEVELASNIGNVSIMPVGSTQTRVLSVLQFGGVARGEYRLLSNALKIGLEVGAASGDSANGFGNRPGRKVGGTDNTTRPGDIDGPQFACNNSGCLDANIRNFRFNSDYRIDLILWRQILGQVTDAVYVRPSANYKITEGFNVFGAVIYSRALMASSTPSTRDANLGVELNVGAKYETDDGFIAMLQWGILFPLEGLRNFGLLGANAPKLETAQALRALIGVKF